MPAGRALLAATVLACATIGVAHAGPAASLRPPTCARCDATNPDDADNPDASQATLDAAYRRLVARPRPHYLRAVIEELGLLGGGAVWYWTNPDIQQVDWTYPKFSDRLTGLGWRYDSNSFPTNFAKHPVTGGFLHLFGRDNDLGLLPSLALGLAGSLSWENGPEYREWVSVNDVIVTTTAGAGIAEFVHWMGRYLESSPAPRWWNTAVRWGLTPVRALHDRLDGTLRPRPGTRPDALGFSSDIWHRFGVSAGLSMAVLGGDIARPGALRLTQIALSGQLIALPGYLRARHMRRVFTDGNVTGAQIRVDFGDAGDAVYAASETMLAGYHSQDLPADGPGTATTLGLTLGFRYRHDRLDEWIERLAQLHLGGVAFDQQLRGSDVSVRVRGRLSPDFAGVHAAAYPQWKAAHPRTIESSILRAEGYYFAWGISADLDLEITLPRLSVGGSLGYASYRSDESRDRSPPPALRLDVAGDRVFDWDAWVRLAPVGGRFCLEGRVVEERRDGSVGSFTSSQDLRRYQLTLGTAL